MGEAFMNSAPAQMKYVGFCDLLGFSKAVLGDFEAAVAVYQEFRSRIRDWPFPTGARVSIYSDSMLVVGDDLPPVLHTIVALQWSGLTHNWLIRGGVAHGRHWEESENGNLFVVSDALVQAAEIEKSIKVPAVAVSSSIPLGIEAWMPRFEHGVFKAPLLFFQDLAIVNPFCTYWFRSAVIHAERLLALHPDHREKYEWFLSLAAAVERDDVPVPDSALKQMLELGVLCKREQI
jgi:hypothetical protein